MNRPIVYISGPISKGDPARNYDQASRIHRELIAAGFAPINPVLTITLPWEAEVEHGTWIDCDLPLVERSDALFRLPGESAGADQEVEFASAIGIPVYVDIADIVADRAKLPIRGCKCSPEPQKSDAEIRAERQQVYGDPLENHKGIAQMWSPLLQPHWRAIKEGNPIPAWAVALLMCGLKLDRMRLRFHRDNYSDLRNYAAFAEEWQPCEK